jgi:hypothetical protein
METFQRGTIFADLDNQQLEEQQNPPGNIKIKSMQYPKIMRRNNTSLRISLNDLNLAIFIFIFYP